MKLFTSCLVLCAVLGIALAQFQDSPAVAAAKAAHFEAVRRAENVIANAPASFVNNNQYQHRKPVEETSQHKLGLNVHDTPEVAAAKAAHYAAVRNAAEATAIANSTANYPDSFAGVQYQQHQHRAPAVYSPPPTPSLNRRPAPVHHYQSAPVPSVVQTTQHKLGVNVQETPEVAAARAAHFEAHRHAAANSGLVEYEDTYVMVASPRRIAPMEHYGQRAHQYMYSPQTYEPNFDYRQIPVVAVPQTNQHKLGLNVEDTPEVAAAKKAHFEAFRRAAAVGAQNEYPAPRNNYFSEPTRQYGQVNY